MNSEIRNAQGEKLDYRFHEPSDGAAATAGSPIVVIGHGVTANLDRPFIAALAEGVAAAGIPALRFSFAGNGDSEGTFQACTITKEVADLGSMLDAVEKDERFGSIIYAGHSMGGAVGVIRASSDSRIKALVSLAGMVNTRQFAEAEFGDQTPDSGFMWDEEDCPLSSEFMNDLASIHSVAPMGADIQVPWLLVHGSEDDLVPPGDAEEIVGQAGDDARLIEIPGGDHVFSGEAQSPMVQAVVNWIGTLDLS